MSGRKILAELLREALPAWQIVSDARAIDSVRRPGAIVLWTSERRRLALNQMTTLQDTIQLWVLSGADAIKLEDDLDGLLLQVLNVLEPQPSFEWDTATRGTLGDETKWPGWGIELTCLYALDTEPDEEPDDN